MTAQVSNTFEHLLMITICISNFAHCWDKIPEKSNLRKKSLFWFKVRVHSRRENVMDGAAAGHMCPQLGSSVTKASAQLTFPFLGSQGTHGMVLPTVVWVFLLQLA